MQDLRRNSDRVEGSAAPENARALSATDVIPARDTLTIALDETSNTALAVGLGFQNCIAVVVSGARAPVLSTASSRAHGPGCEKSVHRM